MTADTFPTSRIRTHGPWLGILAIGLLFALGMSLSSSDTEAPSLLIIGSGLTAVCISIFYARRMPPSSRSVWWLLTGMISATFLGDIGYDYLYRVVGADVTLAFPDFFYLLSYIFWFAAIVKLVNKIDPSGWKDNITETLIFAVAGVTVIAVFILRPLLSDPTGGFAENAIIVAYPLLDLAVLASIARLLIAIERPSPSLVLLGGSYIAYLLVDTFYAFASLSGDLLDGVDKNLESGYALAIYLGVAAFAAPGAGSIASYGVDNSANFHIYRRLAWMAVCVATPPAMLAYLAWTDPSSDWLHFLAFATFVMVALVAWRVRQLLETVQRQADLLAEQARIDPLTGLPNRRTLEYHLNRVIGRVNDAQSPPVVAMLDLDHFKRYNDTHGHTEADRVLEDASSAWKQALGAQGFLARYGGEEFCVVIEDVLPREVHKILEELRLATPHGQTVSIGYAVHRNGEDIRETLHRADQFLYEAKRTGRNKVTGELTST